MTFLPPTIQFMRMQGLPLVQSLPSFALQQVYEDELVVTTLKRSAGEIAVIASVQGFWCQPMRCGILCFGYALQRPREGDADESIRQFADDISKHLIATLPARKELIDCGPEGAIAGFFQQLFESFKSYSDELRSTADRFDAPTITNVFDIDGGKIGEIDA